MASVLSKQIAVVTRPLIRVALALVPLVLILSACSGVAPRTQVPSPTATVAPASSLPLSLQSYGVTMTLTAYCSFAFAGVYALDIVVRNDNVRDSVFKDTIVVGDSSWKATTISGRVVALDRSTIPVVRVALGEHVTGRVSFKSTERLDIVRYDEIVQPMVFVFRLSALSPADC